MRTFKRMSKRDWAFSAPHTFMHASALCMYVYLTDWDRNPFQIFFQINLWLWLWRAESNEKSYILLNIGRCKVCIANYTVIGNWKSWKTLSSIAMCNVHNLSIIFQFCCHFVFVMVKQHTTHNTCVPNAFF